MHFARVSSCACSTSGGLLEISSCNSYSLTTRSKHLFFAAMVDIHNNDC